jgi:site-specific DNA-methyltransferase (cytosine-N4-specific)
VSAKFVVGDTRAVTATLPDGSVDLVMTSPPFLALRSYLPADHPDKANEIGSEATPAAFIQVMLELTAGWRRVLAPHGSIVVELGDTYSGSVAFDGTDAFAITKGRGKMLMAGTGPVRDRKGDAWPRAKSLVGIPERYRLSLIDGVNICNGQSSPAGRWQVRNVIRWVRPNPPVGALGKKWRPATSDLVVATPDDDRRYWDDVATRAPGSSFDRPEGERKGRSIHGQAEGWTAEKGLTHNPAGAPLLDWWKIVPKGYEGAHYAVYPPELCVAPIDAMCPRRVCRTCGRPSERVQKDTSAFDTTQPKLAAAIRASRQSLGLTLRQIDAWFGLNGMASHWECIDGQAAIPAPAYWSSLKERLGLSDEFDDVVLGERRWTESTIEYVDDREGASLAPDERSKDYRRGGNGSQPGRVDATRLAPTGWTTCGHPGTDGLRLDGFHDGPGWRPGIVYDPFAGTGTTLAVATGMGRDAIGADIDSRNASLALERVGPLLLTVETLGEVAA